MSSPPRASSLSGRATRTRYSTPRFRCFPPIAVAYFGTSPASTPNMAPATENKHNAWIGSAGAAGSDLRSEFHSLSH